jgi:hypothetical protein
MPISQHNSRVVNSLRNQLFTGRIHYSFSTHLDLVTSADLTRLTLLFRRRGWADRPAINSRKTEFARPRITALQNQSCLSIMTHRGHFLANKKADAGNIRAVRRRARARVAPSAQDVFFAG